MEMSATDREFLKYFTQLDEPKKKSLLELIRTFLKPDADPEERTSIEQYNIDLNAAMERVSKGAFTTVEDLEKEMLSWQNTAGKLLDKKSAKKASETFHNIMAASVSGNPKPNAANKKMKRKSNPLNWIIIFVGMCILLMLFIIWLQKNIEEIQVLD